VSAAPKSLTGFKLDGVRHFRQLIDKTGIIFGSLLLLSNYLKPY